MPEPGGRRVPRVGEAELEAAIRRYLAQVAARAVRRSLPLAGLLAVVLVVLLVPPVRRSSGVRAGQAGSGAAGGSPLAGAGAPPSSTRAFLSSGLPTGSTASTTSPAGALRRVATSSSRSPATSPSGAPGTEGGAPPGEGTAGVAVTGVRCGPGVRQFAWSAYAPPCVPAWHGDNGGATAPGVTATTITLTYRLSYSAQQSALNAVGGDAVPQDAAYVADLRTYVAYFNREFELYGRHVVLKTFQGQGDYVAEDQGQDLAAAQADAVTARDLGAFGDVTFLLTSSIPYEEDLAAEHVISFSPTGDSHRWFAAYRPYEYSIWASGTKIAASYVDTVCERMAHLPAVFAGSATLRGRTRVFGLLTPDSPDYLHVGDEVASGLASCGAGLAKREAYPIDEAQMEQVAVSAVAQLRAKGVTTVLCLCDPVFPVFLTQAADQQGYHPEWLVPNYLDPAARLPAQDQWSHAISVDGWPMPSASSSEPDQVYARADPGHAPAEQYAMVAYYTLLEVFDGLQMAGPHLTPESFAAGLAALPALGPGQLGTWSFGPDRFTAPATTLLEWWDPGAQSSFDGKPGTWVPCDAGAWVTYEDPPSYGPAHRQLACFGH
jgi:hypothetical protein